MRINLISDDELYHHGILGQRWGVRRYQNPDGSLTEAGKKKYLKKDGTLNRKGEKLMREKQILLDKKKDEDSRYRGTLSDKELLDKITRLQKEKQLRELTESELHPYRKIVKGILKEAGSKAAKDILTKAATGGVLYMMSKNGEKDFNLSDLKMSMGAGEVKIKQNNNDNSKNKPKNSKNKPKK